MSKIKEQINDERSLYRFLDTYTAYTPLTGEQAIAGKLINSNGEVQEAMIHYGDLLEAVLGYDIAEETDRRTGWAERHSNENPKKQPTVFYEQKPAEDEDADSDDTENSEHEASEPTTEDNQPEGDTGGDDFDSGRTTEVPSLQASQTGSVSENYVKKLEKQKLDVEAPTEDMSEKVEHVHDNITTPEFRALGTAIDMDQIKDIAEISRMRSMTPEERKAVNKRALERMKEEGREETFSAVAAMQSQLRDESEQAKITDSEDNDGSGDGKFY